MKDVKWIDLDGREDRKEIGGKEGGETLIIYITYVKGKSILIKGKHEKLSLM